MIMVGDVLISEELLEEQFVCDLQRCKGACCVEGDAGAPLLVEEAGVLEDELEAIKPFLPASGVAAIEQQGVFEMDEEGDLLTPLVEGKHCAFTVFDAQGTAGCGIELAWKAGRTSLRKPLSCHLYPIRVARLSHHDALNYHRWEICSPACSLGKSLKVPVYVFLKDALVRAYGSDWYNELCIIAENWKSAKGR